MLYNVTACYYAIIAGWMASVRDNTGGIKNVKTVSAEKTSAREGAWVPQAYEDEKRAQGACPPPRKRSGQTFRVNFPICYLFPVYNH